jgi:hypothetical protein
MSWPSALGGDRRAVLHLVLVASAAVLFVLAAPTAARAQLVGSATLESDYRLRGLSLTNGQADLRLGLAYDFASGAYAGASVIAAQPAHVGLRALGYVAYAGFARQTEGGLGWDVGATDSQIDLRFSASQLVRTAPDALYTPGGEQTYRVHYSEVYGGLSMRDLSARLYLSPNYLGQHLRTAYLDVTAASKPADRLRLFAHVGALTPLGGSAGPNSRRERYDLGAGAGWEFRNGEVQLAWTTITEQVEYPIGYRQSRAALTLSVTGYF